jgi:hypothetical protein
MSIQKLVADPDMLIDPGIAELWASKIKNRLHCELETHVVEASWILELLMVGERLNNLKQTIVITCRTEKATKQIRKLCKELKWLKRICNEHHLRVAAHVQRFGLNWKVRNPGASVVKTCSVDIIQDSRTFCGQKVRIFSEEGGEAGSCTFGGLITVGHTVYGITAGHPFGAVDDHDSSAKSQSGEPPDYESSSDSEDPFVSFDSDVDEDASSTSSIDDRTNNSAMASAPASETAQDSPDMRYLTSTSRARMPVKDLDHCHTSDSTGVAEYSDTGSFHDERNSGWFTEDALVSGPQTQELELQPEHEVYDLPKESREATVTLADNGNLSGTRMGGDWALIDLSGWPDLLPI